MLHFLAMRVHPAVPSAARIHHDACHHLALCVNINAVVTSSFGEKGVNSIERAIRHTGLLRLEEYHFRTGRKHALAVNILLTTAYQRKIQHLSPSLV